ncbi:MAG TPA: dihydrofolate reductase family protein [Rubrobacteraceae bacterium]|nr:dihydrofolate reductase family protein [Rubrobacteraceae bacterium]
MTAAIKIYPPPSETFRVEDLYTDIEFPDHNITDPSLPYVVINMVSSLDGKAALNGVANGIGGPADRRVMRNLRSRADAVLRGAGTLRAEKISAGVPEDLARRRMSEGRPAQPLELILSRSDTASLSNLLNASSGTVALVTQDRGPVKNLEDMERIVVPARPDGLVDLVKAMIILKRDHGLSVILLEGGPSLNHALISSGLVSELFLTLSHRLLGGSQDQILTLLNGQPLPPELSTPLRLISAHLTDDEWFLRYKM